MKIVVLDGHTANPGDLDWSPLRNLGDLTVYDRTPADQVADRSAGATVLVTNKVPLPRPVLEGLPDLKLVTVCATGYNIVDTVAARELGIVVANVPAYSTPSVVQLTFALLLELTHHVGEHNDSVHRGEWVACQDFSYSLTPLIELEGLTMGIVGLGNIGRGVAAVARAFGMEIATLDRPSAQGLSGVRRMSLEELFAVSDVVSLHSPQTPETTGMVNRDLLSRMKPSAFLLNTSRGGLIVEQDLADALNEGKIAGAGLDVLSVEPPKPDNPLLTAKNCVITPHIAWASLSARRRLLDVTFKNVEAFLTGNPQNVVNA